jgi:predicted MFS family arabinose efflux permease
LCHSEENPREEELVVPTSVFALSLVVFGFTTGEFVVANIVPDVSADLRVSAPAAGVAVAAVTLAAGPLVLRYVPAAPGHADPGGGGSHRGADAWRWP